MNKSLLCLLVAVSLGACSSDGGTAADPTAPGADPITGSAAGSTGDGRDAAVASNDVPAEASVDRGTAASGDLIDEGNYDALVREALAIYTGRAYGAGVLALPPHPGLRELPTDGPYGSTSREDVCDNGGTARLHVEWGGARVVTYDRHGAFDGCQVGALVLDGEIGLSETDNVRLASSGLAIDDGTTTRRFSGGVAYGDGNNYGGSNERWWTASEVAWSWDDGRGGASLENASTFFTIVAPRAYSLRGGFTLTSEATGNRPLVATIPVPFDLDRTVDGDDPSFAPDDWDFPVGTLKLRAADGSSVTLDADNGDASSVRVTLDGSAGSSAFDRPWSDWNGPLRAGPSP